MNIRVALLMMVAVSVGGSFSIVACVGEPPAHADDAGTPPVDGSTADASTEAGDALAQIDANDAGPTGPFEWATTLNSQGNSRSALLTVDPAGNVYVAMMIADTVTIPLIAGGVQTVTSSTQYGGLVVKLEPTGQKAFWATAVGGNGVSIGIDALAVGASGDVYLAGYVYGNALTFGGTTIPASTNQNGLIAKIRADGTPDTAYALNADMNASSECSALATRGPSGSTEVVAGCSYSGNVDFGGGLVSSTSADVAVFSLNSSLGAGTWRAHFGGTKRDIPDSLSFLASGDVLVSGHFDSPTIDIDSVHLTLTPSSSADAFLFDLAASSSTVTFGKNWGGSGRVSVARHVRREDGTIVLAGTYSITFNAGLGSMPSFGGNDIFLFALDLSNAVTPTQWQRHFGGAMDEGVGGMAANGAGEILVGGYFQSTGFAIGGKTLPDPPASGGAAGYVAKIDPVGATLWAYAIEGAEPGAIFSTTSVALAPTSGKAVYAGVLPSPANLGGGTTTNPVDGGPLQETNYLVERGP